MPVPPPPPQQRQLPPLAWAGIVGGVLLAAVLVALLAVQLAVLTDSRKHIAAQDAKITALLEGTRPALRQAGPAVREARPLIRAARPLVRDARASLRGLRGATPDLATAAQAVPPLLRAGQTLVALGIPVLRDIEAAALPRVLGGADAVIGMLLYRGRLARVLDATDALLAEVQSTDLVARAARSTRLAPVLIYLQRRLLRVQRRTLRVQRDTRAIQARTLRVQLEALRHIESIDRKTGGQVPPTAPATTPAVP